MVLKTFLIQIFSGFSEELVTRNSLELVTRNSLDRVTRISSEWVTRNSWVKLLTFSPDFPVIFWIFRGFPGKIPGNFHKFSAKLLLGKDLKENPGGNKRIG